MSNKWKFWCGIVWSVAVALTVCFIVSYCNYRGVVAEVASHHYEWMTNGIDYNYVPIRDALVNAVRWGVADILYIIGIALPVTIAGLIIHKKEGKLNDKENN